ncbi:hypothetical protein [Bosea sp. OK403]|uniref:hypothetical protein n=1 Tax=Bosea sp. OK403 TaxID=1855286 RepID=UPI00111379CD|nr:hypothetical protein [Bosea sp. OK403]
MESDCFRYGRGLSVIFPESLADNDAAVFKSLNIGEKRAVIPDKRRSRADPGSMPERLQVRFRNGSRVSLQSPGMTARFPKFRPTEILAHIIDLSGPAEACHFA